MMIAGVVTWQSYGALLARLLPKLERALLARADGTTLWHSDREAEDSLQPTLGILMRSSTHRPGRIDGLADPQARPGFCYGFRVRGALGEILGFVVVQLRADALDPPDVAEVHAALAPALDCLGGELAARSALGELAARLADDGRHLDLYRRLSGAGLGDDVAALKSIPALALEYLPGIVAALVLPERRISICRSAPDCAHPLDTPALSQLHYHLMTRVQLHGGTLVANHLSLDGSRAAIPYKAISTPIHDARGRVAGVLAVFRADADEQFELHDAEVIEMLARKAGAIVRSSFDPATGLLTEAAFVAQAEAEIAREDARAAAYGVLYVDVDQLHAVNESHGMPVGDEILGEIAAMLAAKLRPGMSAARVGGDRFAMLVPGCGMEPAARIAEELRAAAIKLSRPQGAEPVLVSLSIGVAKAGDGEHPVRRALAAAEAACRGAKRRGRNRVEMHAEGRAGRVLGRDGAAPPPEDVAESAFALLAQPVLPLGGTPADPRFELLARLGTADGAHVGYDKWTGDFGGAALARRIDAMVVERALSRLAACRDVLREHPASFWMNLSAASLADATFWRELEERLRAARLPAGTVGFEFPESAIDGQAERIAPMMQRLRSDGVGFALDNFGRHGGSLASLRALPLSAVKIDGALCRDLLHDPRARSTFLAVTKLAQAFGLDAIATHVETDAARARAAEFGADFGQGFLIGRPAPFDEILHDLPLYSCFSTSTGLFDAVPRRTAAAAG